MKILLVEPESNSKAPNLGILYVASAICRGPHDALLLDLNGVPLPDPVGRIVDIVAKENVDIVGLSLNDVNFQWSMDLAEKVKAATGKTLLGGGPQANSLGKAMLRDHSALDYVLRGESDDSILDFLNFIAGEAAASSVPGLIYREHGTIKENPTQVVTHLDRLSPPDYGLFGIEHLSGYMLLTSRGCPYKCTFCCRNTGTVWRPRSLDACMDELAAAKAQLGIKSFRIVDASFNLREQRTIDFAKRLVERDLGLHWMVSGIRADRLTEASIAAFKAADCSMLAIGIESIDPQVFDQIDKGETIEDILRAIRLCQKHDLEVGCYMIHGLPGDGYERSIHYARELQALRPSYVMYNQAVPFTGTKLHAWVSEHGHLSPDYSWLNTRDVDHVAYHTDDFSEQERIDSFKIIQTITRVINFTKDDLENLARLQTEIRDNDVEYYDFHMRYIEETIKNSQEKNKIKQQHNEADTRRRQDYTGCMNVRTGAMI